MPSLCTYWPANIALSAPTDCHALQSKAQAMAHAGPLVPVDLRRFACCRAEDIEHAAHRRDRDSHRVRMNGAYYGRARCFLHLECHRLPTFITYERNSALSQCILCSMIFVAVVKSSATRPSPTSAANKTSFQRPHLADCCSLLLPDLHIHLRHRGRAALERCSVYQDMLFALSSTPCSVALMV